MKACAIVYNLLEATDDELKDLIFSPRYETHAEVLSVVRDWPQFSRSLRSEIYFEWVFTSPRPSPRPLKLVFVLNWGSNEHGHRSWPAAFYFVADVHWTYWDRLSDMRLSDPEHYERIKKRMDQATLDFKRKLRAAGIEFNEPL